MDIQRNINVLVDLERRFDVEQLRFADAHVWPVLRNELNSLMVAGEAKRKIRSRSRMLSNLTPKGLWGDLRAWRNRRRLAADLKRLARDGADKVWVVNNPVHSEQIGQAWFDRYTDPLLELLGSDGVKVELKKTQLAPRSIDSISVDLAYAIDKNVLNFNEQDKIAGLDEVLEAFSQLSAIKAPDQQSVMSWMTTLNIKALVLQKALEVAKPPAVFVVCYYANNHRPVMLACRRLGIPVIDIQHGKQGSINKSYSHFTKIPDAGWDSLPDCFWVWGKQSRDDILRHRQPGTAHHIPVIGGNAWMSLWKSGRAFELKQQHQKFLDSLAVYEKTILISLQPIAEPLPEHVLDAMRASPTGWHWLVRMHPNMKAEADSIRARLEQVAPGRFELDFSATVPLYALLRVCSHHLTGWSSVAYEALAFDVPTTIFHTTGAEMYKEDIAGGVFKYADTPDAMLAALSDDNRAERDEPYIIADLDHVSVTLKNLINGYIPQ